jgi:stage II sporulation protein P
MNAYLEKYPSIKYVIDVHRDSMITATGEKYKPTVSINGKNAAQIMMVVGTSDGGAAHPNWTDNLTFATYTQQKLNDKYPMLARPINLRSARFNQHVTKGSVILEVGSCGSSFDEALYAANLFGECFAELITENARYE